MRNYEERERVRQTALQVIEEKGIAICGDVSSKLQISKTSAAFYLVKNHRDWKLGRINIAFYPSRQSWAYYKLGTDDENCLVEREKALENIRRELTSIEGDDKTDKNDRYNVGKRHWKEREIVRKTAYQIIDENGIVFSKDIAERTGINKKKVGIFLNYNFERWKMKIKYLSPRMHVSIPVYLSAAMSDEEIDKTLRNATIKLRAEETERKRIAAEERAKKIVKKQVDPESLEQKINRIMEELHSGGSFNFTNIMEEAREEIGKVRANKSALEILNAFEKAIDSETGKYKFKDGYVS